MKKENLVILVSWVMVLLMAFLVHGSPSEAYFPALFVPLALIWGIFFTKMSEKSNVLRALAVFLVIALAAYQLWFLLGHRMMTYGLGLNQRMKVASFIIKDVEEQKYQIMGLGPGAEFKSFLDNYRYLLWFLGKPPTKENNEIVYTIVEDEETIMRVKKEMKEKEAFSIEEVLIIKRIKV